MSDLTYQTATEDDADAILDLLVAYMRETFDRPWAGTRERLVSDAFGRRAHMHVAVGNREVIAFAAWQWSYDLHHCYAGAMVIDLFVLPPWRGRGVAPCLLAALASEAAARGAWFLTGEAVPSGSVTRLCERVAVRHGQRCYLSGRAFQAFAAAAHRPARELVRMLPDPQWNGAPPT